MSYDLPFEFTVLCRRREFQIRAGANASQPLVVGGIETHEGDSAYRGQRRTNDFSAGHRGSCL